MRSLLLATLVILVSTTAHAQGIGSPFNGVRILGESVVDSDDATAIEINPAGIGYLRSWNFFFYHSQFTNKVGEGDGGFVASPVLGPWRFGLGLQFLRWPLFDEDYAKFTITNAFRIGRTLSIGANFNFLFSDSDEALDNLVSIDIGAVYRPLSWLSLAAVVKDLTSPLYEGTPLNRTWHLGVGFRPGTDRVTFSIQTRIEEELNTVDPGLIIRAEPLGGLRLFAHVEMRPRQEKLGVFFGAGLEVAFSFVGVGGGAYLRREHATAYDGFSAYLRLSGEHYRSLVRPKGVFVAIGLTGQLTERQPTSPFKSGGVTLASLVLYSDRLKRDPAVAGVVFRFSGFTLGWAQAEEVRHLVADFQEAGKKVVFYVDSANTAAYYAACSGDRVFVNPAGGLYLTGLSATLTFWKGALDKLGVKAQFVRIGKYKSYPEAFTQTRPSKANRQVRNEILEGLYSQLTSGIASSRRLPLAKVRALIDNGPYLAKEAKQAGLVDDLLFYDELRTRLERDFKQAVHIRKDYHHVIRRDVSWGRRPQIAIVHIDGSIVEGGSVEIPFIGQVFTGSTWVTQLLERLGEMGSVKAVILRVNSPGGSSLASDIIHRAVTRLDKRKPVIVSFGNVAASGGYYLSCGARKILASRATITGSIGIFGGKFVLSGLFKKLGINRETFKRGQHADIFGYDRELTRGEVVLLQKKIQGLYDLFLERVAKGRKLASKDVDAVGQGHVWLGSQAKVHRLVDAFGGVAEALRLAKKEAGLQETDPIQVLTYPRRASLWQKVRSWLGADTELGFLSLNAKRIADLLLPVLMRYDSYEPLALMPYQLHVE